MVQTPADVIRIVRLANITAINIEDSSHGNLLLLISSKKFMNIIYIMLLWLMVWSSDGIAQDFRGYKCTVDCSGHTAGYEWAERNGITSADECGGNSNSFIEGCQAFADEQEAMSDESSSTNYDDDSDQDIDSEEESEDE